MTSYLIAWGRATRAALGMLRARPSHGFFAPSCLAHASNLRFSSAPTVRGVLLIDAMHAWFFGGNDEPQYLVDQCGDLPCSNATAGAQQCPHLDSVRECHSLCRRARRERRIRLGLNPDAPGRNVCELEPASAREEKRERADTEARSRRAAAERHRHAEASGGKRHVTRHRSHRSKRRRSRRRRNHRDRQHPKRHDEDGDDGRTSRDDD